MGEVFTPGPWVIREGANSHLFDGRLSPKSDADETIAFVDLEGPNARLIAASPDLLEALEHARHTLVAAHNYRVTDLTVEVFDAHLGNGVPRDRLEFMTDYTAELAVIDAAIAKATGSDQ